MVSTRPQAGVRDAGAAADRRGAVATMSLVVVGGIYLASYLPAAVPGPPSPSSAWRRLCSWTSC